MGNETSITRVYEKYGDPTYELKLYTGNHYWIDKELELIEENNMSAKYYRVVKDTPFWETGAIVSNTDNENHYKAINDVFMKQDSDGYDFDSSLGMEDSVVEYSNFFERVYPMGKLEKMVFGNKKQAQAAATALYKGGKN